MPRIPEAFRFPATVTTHQVDDHDAPGGTDLEVQLLEQGEVPPSEVHGGRTHLIDRTGLVFPARQASSAPAPAEVPRREPWTAPEISLEIPPDRAAMHQAGMESDAHLLTDPDDNDQLAIQVPRRQLLEVARIRVAGQVTLDGTGAGTAELTPGQWGGGAPGAGAGVQQNQRWLLDRVVARAGAAGSCLIYAGAVANDQDLVAALALVAPAFAAQVDGNAVQLNPGWRVAAVFAGGGAAAIGTVVAYYRVMAYGPGLAVT